MNQPRSKCEAFNLIMLRFWSISYRNNGVGNAWAGQFRFNVPVLLTECTEILSTLFIFGPTEPTGSLRKFKFQVFYSC